MGSVALHPAAICSEDEAVGMFSEVLDHVVASGLAMYKEIEANFFLEINDQPDLLNKVLIFSFALG